MRGKRKISRHAAPDHIDQPRRNAGRDRDPERTSSQAEQQAFDKQLLHHACALGSQGVADRHFANTPRGPNQQQAAHVGARHQGHEPDHPHDDEQWLLHVRAQGRESLGSVANEQMRLGQETFLEVLRAVSRAVSTRRHEWSTRAD